MFGVRCLCGIHIIYSGAVIRGDRQGLYLYGKSEASRCGTHLLKAGSPIVEVRHRRIILNIPHYKMGMIKDGFYKPPFLFYSFSLSSFLSSFAIAVLKIDEQSASKKIAIIQIIHVIPQRFVNILTPKYTATITVQ